VRQIMQCGLYPHRGGSMGFYPIKPEVRSPNEQWHEAGYLISMFGNGPRHLPIRSPRPSNIVSGTS
jgi:hypothetical protein